MATQDYDATQNDASAGAPAGKTENAEGGAEQIQLAQVEGARPSGSAESSPANQGQANAVTITPPAPGARVEVEVEPGQTILLQGIDLSTAQIQQLDGGLLITLANGAVIYLIGFVEAAQSANPPVIEIAGLGRGDLLGNEDFAGGPPGPEFGRATISAGDLLAAAQGEPLNLQPAAGPEGPPDGGGARFGSEDPGDIGDGLPPGSLLANEDFFGSPPEPEFGESDGEETAPLTEPAPPAVERASGVAVEDELPGGSGADSASPPLTTSVTGTLVFSDGTITDLSFTGDPTFTGPALPPVDDGTTITMTAGDGSWTMVIDKVTGNFTFTLNGPLDHTDPNQTFGTDTLTGTFTATVTGPGGSATGDIVITIHDDGPVAAVDPQASLDTLMVDESPVPPDGDGIASTTADFSDSFTAPAGFGADGPGSVSYGLVLTGTNVASGLFALDAADTDVGDGDGFGQGSEILLNQTGDTITGSAGGTDYFTISIDPDTGVVTFTQLANIWHGDTGDDDDTSALALASADLLQVVQTVTDADGDSATASVDLGAGVFKIEDDGPDAVDDGVIAVAEDTPTVINVQANDVPGTDGVDFTDDTKVVLASGPSLGTAVYNDDGTFTYTPDPGASGADSFTYTITDADGDTDTATVSLNIAEDSTPLASATDSLLDEDDLSPLGSDQTPEPAGNQVDEGSITVDFSSDQPADLTAAFAFTGGSPATGPNGEAITYTPSGDGQSLTASIGGVDVFAIAITGTTDNGGGNVTYDYEVTLLAEMDHLIGDNGENAFDFTANYTVTDSDGDPVNDSFDVTVVDDVPSISVDGAGPELTVDETTLAIDDSASFVTNFSGNGGADGAASTTYALSITGGDGTASGLTDTLTGESVLLFNNGGVIEGRTSGTNDVVFTVSVDGSGNVTLDQQRAVVHSPDSGPDQSTTLSAANLVQLTATITDGDGDTDTATLDIGQNLNFEDDAPEVDVVADAEPDVGPLAVNLDETIDPDENDNPGDGEDHYNADLAEGESSGGPSNGDNDDIAGQLSVDGTNPIGTLTTSVGALSGLFSVNPDAGADGEQSLASSFALALSGEGLETTLNATQPASGGNPDSDVGDAIDFTPYPDPTIYLFTVSDTVIEGRVGGESGPVAFRITLNDPDDTVLGDETVTVEQILAIDHGDDGNLYDTELPLNIVDGSLSVTLTVDLTDGDDDTASDSDSVTVIDGDTTFVSFDDDGPAVDVESDAASEELAALDLVLDESIGDDPDGPNDLFGPDDDVATLVTVSTAPLSTEAIGRQATSEGDLANLFVDALVDFGTDGEGSRSDKLTFQLTGGVTLTTLVVTALAGTALAGMTEAERTVSLTVNGDGTVVEGVIPGTGTDADGDEFVAFRITLENAEDPAAATLVVEQFLPFDHGVDVPSLLDESAPLLMADGGSLDLTLTTTVVDGDSDMATDSASVTLIDDSGQTFVAFEDDGPVFVSADQGILTNTVNAVVTGNIVADFGTDGAGEFSLVGNTAPDDLTAGGQPVSYFVDPSDPTLLIAHIEGTDPNVLVNQVFTLQANGDGTYTFTLLKSLDAIETVPIGAATAFGSGPSAFQILSENESSEGLAIISGGGTGAINGSTAGWGIDNNMFGTGETIRLDFGDQEPGSPGPGSFDGPAVSAATVSLLDYSNGDQIQYQAFFVDTDGNPTGDSGVVLVTVSGGGGNIDTTVPITAPDGQFIDYIDFEVVSAGGQGGRLDLEDVTTITNTGTLDLAFDIDMTDGDGDSATGTIGITVDGSTDVLDGTAGNDSIAGNDEAQTLNGLAGDDTLFGDGGNDLLIGGAGADTLTGGAGADTFAFAAGDGGSTVLEADQILDFADGTDVIGLLDGLAFGTNAGEATFVSADTVGGDAGDTALIVSDGGGGATEILAVIQNVDVANLDGSDTNVIA